MLNVNNALKITYHKDISEKNVYIYFTGSTMHELFEVVDKMSDIPPRDLTDPDIDAFDMYWFGKLSFIL